MGTWWIMEWTVTFAVQVQACSGILLIWSALLIQPTPKHEETRRGKKPLIDCTVHDLPLWSLKWQYLPQRESAKSKNLSYYYYCRKRGETKIYRGVLAWASNAAPCFMIWFGAKFVCFIRHRIVGTELIWQPCTLSEVLQQHTVT